MLTLLGTLFGLMAWKRRQESAARNPAEGLPAQTLTALQLQQKLIEAYSERDILEAVLQAGVDILQAQGASFVPFDEYVQTLPALMAGEIPETALKGWSMRLTAPETRSACKNCQVLHGGPGCVLLPADLKGPAVTHCFPLQFGGREAGALNYFFTQPQEISYGQRVFLAEALQSAGKALENLRAREQEMTALRYLQNAPAPKASLQQQLLNNLLQNVQRALDTDFALLYLPDGLKPGISSQSFLLTVQRAEENNQTPLPESDFLDGLWQSALKSGHSISLENITLNDREMWKVLLAIPLTWQGSPPVGVLVLGSSAAQVFAPRQRVLLETLAAQAALLVENARLMVQVEYQAVVEERTRLAREIHDGLAQTLAFLKIQAAQMQNYLAQGEMEQLGSTLQANYRALSDAYLDARQAIDNLRRSPGSALKDWLQVVINDFEQASGLKVQIEDFLPATGVDFSPTTQAQLIRIVQEAFSNIRKHAQAQRVWLTFGIRENDFLLEVRDDGQGFDSSLTESRSRYGLRGMRERADSIGAEFQILSRPGEGTALSLALPINVKEEL